jgi:uncharacterized protein (DUF1499 family)
MAFIFKTLYWVVGVLLASTALLFIAGQLGALHGTAPADLGVTAGRLKPPSLTPNSVSSQASLYPDHPQRTYAQIAPLKMPSSAAMDKLVSAVQATEGCRIARQDSRYLYAQCTTRWLQFTDDVEFWQDDGQAAFQVRSASRLGESDLGANRSRVEAIRARLTP